MRTGTLAFMLGIIAVQFLPSLPGMAFLLLPAGILIPVIRIKRYRRFLLPLLFFLCGFCWTLFLAQQRLDNRIPDHIEGLDVQVRGAIVGLPRFESTRTYFTFKVDEIKNNGRWHEAGWMVRLKWFSSEKPALQPGQRWLLTVRLKRPYGLQNPSAFDYEKWLFANNISATGYVRLRHVNKLLKTAGAGAMIDRVRLRLSDKLDDVLAGHDMTGIVRALALGDRRAMSPAQWEVLNRTGTSHLVAISGLHVGLVAAVVFFLTGHMVRLSAWLCRLQPAPVYAAIASLFAAVVYAALAGFSLPTQRALIMLSVVMLGIVFRHKLNVVDVLLAALLLVLLWDPFAVLATGFWLSFVAVAVILYVMSARLRAPTFYKQWGMVQWAASLGLMPLLWLFFARISLLAPLVNLVAVPWVSFISLPLLMLSMFALLFDMHSPLLFAADSLALIWQLFEWAAAIPWSSFYLHDIPWWMYVITVPAIAWLLLPGAVPAKWVACCCLVWPFLYEYPAPAESEVHLHVLDVGQGQAILVRTSNHAMLYDTGARFSEDFDMGQAVVLPVLRHYGIDRLDKLVVSHADNDHSGGLKSILAAVETDDILSGDTAAMPVPARRCFSGQSWHWDGVDFNVLHPDENQPLEAKSNNRSCVLRIDNGRFSALLTGDIESSVESRLAREQRNALDADILLVPHHGSKTSSSQEFLNAVEPRLAVFSLGYRNRYRFPNEQVFKRYQQGGTALYRTDKTGMLELVMPAEGDIRDYSWREQARRYWHAE